MSEENLNIARALYPGTFDLVKVFWSPEGLEAVRSHIDPDVEAVFEERGLPMGAATMAPDSDTAQPVVRGFEAFVATWQEWVSAWDTWVMTPTDFVEVDDERVLVGMEVRARSKTHQVEFSVDGANLLTLRNGKVTRVELFFDQSRAREAAGLA